MKTILVAFSIAMVTILTPVSGFGAQKEGKLVVRIDDVYARMKGRTLVVEVIGMGRTKAMIRGGGWLLPHNGSHELNKDGLLEYDLYYKAPPNYNGFSLKSVHALLKERSFPPEVKGVRIYSELNAMNSILAQPKKKEKRQKFDSRI